MINENFWQRVIDTNPDRQHYSVLKVKDGFNDEMFALRTMFPDAKANELNFVLFSTSGVHGTNNTIEEAEKRVLGVLNEDGENYCKGVTFLIVHPRLVSLRYGECNPYTSEDIEFLKKLRASSHDVVKNIGMY
jgi:hypothetical protein